MVLLSWVGLKHDYLCPDNVLEIWYKVKGLKCFVSG